MTTIPEAAVEAVYHSRSGQAKKIGDFITRSALLAAYPHLVGKGKK